MIRKEDIVLTARTLVSPHSKNEEALCRVVRGLSGIGSQRASVADFVAAIEHAADSKCVEVSDEETHEEVAVDPDPQEPAADEEE